MRRVSRTRHRPRGGDPGSGATRHRARRALASFENEVKNLVQQGKYRDAIEYFDEHFSEVIDRILECGIPLDMCTLSSFKVMGVCYAMKMRQIWSETGYKPPHWIEVGNALFDEGKYEEAIGAYFRRIMEDRRDDRAWYLMGCAHRAMGNPYESDEAWETALRIVVSEYETGGLPGNPGGAKD